ncbi:MAG: YbaK/EbsC family protein [Caldilineales bacterium]|nr:YbaK/EbsC family protein [Caldilineales bacterium]MDW8317075.1 YbaK/EbsC family protein [Anaerolineae bacterium]
MRTPADLDQYIRKHGIAAALVAPPHETPTVPLAAQAMGCAEEQIIKSVVFLVKDDAIPRAALVITNGTAPIDYRKLAALMGVSRKRLRLASAEEVVAITGYPAGGVPPFGFSEPLETWVDARVMDQPVVYGGGGDERTLLRTTPAELLRVTGGRVVDVRAGP